MVVMGVMGFVKQIYANYQAVPGAQQPFRLLVRPTRYQI
ncbi:hypothetical protein ACN38_g6871, partial [Penicillium nordicum]